MFEALIMGKPIIAPNHEPFRYEVERYGIGLLYDLNDSQSLVKTLRRAKELGANSFCENILKYQETLLEKNVIFSVEKQIKTIL
jgi:glycosyltransferase involved in cell wall biosynthesis